MNESKPLGLYITLREKRRRDIFNPLDKRYPVTKHAEITLEANPDSANDWRALRALRKAGFNRISLGMQSADDAELREIGRIHTMDQVRQAVDAARKAKFDNLSLDLIYGLPHQTLELWRRNLEAAVALTPQHLSCYGLKVEEGTPLYARRETAGLPGAEEQAEMSLAAEETAPRDARPGYEARHNLKYGQLGEYAGFGPGAHSDFGGVRYAYERDLEGYIRGVLEGAPLLSECERIPPLDRDTEYLMLGLRTVAGIQPKVFERRYRRKFDCFRPFLERCRQSGYAVEESDGSWHLTPQGFLLSNQIIGEMLDILGKDKQRQAEAKARGDYRVQ